MTSKSLRVSSTSYRKPDTTSVLLIEISMTSDDGCTPQPPPCHPVHHTLHTLRNLYHVLHMFFQRNTIPNDHLRRPRHDPNICDHESIHQYPRLPINLTVLPEVRLSYQHPCTPRTLRRLSITYGSIRLRPYTPIPATRGQLIRLLNDLLFLLVPITGPMPSRCYSMISDYRRR